MLRSTCAIQSIPLIDTFIYIDRTFAALFYHKHTQTITQYGCLGRKAEIDDRGQSHSCLSPSHTAFITYYNLCIHLPLLQHTETRAASKYNQHIVLVVTLVRQLWHICHDNSACSAANVIICILIFLFLLFSVYSEMKKNHTKEDLKTQH